MSSTYCHGQKKVIADLAETLIIDIFQKERVKFA